MIFIPLSDDAALVLLVWEPRKIVAAWAPLIWAKQTLKQGIHQLNYSSSSSNSDGIILSCAPFGALGWSRGHNSGSSYRRSHLHVGCWWWWWWWADDFASLVIFLCDIRQFMAKQNIDPWKDAWRGNFERFLLTQPLGSLPTSCSLPSGPARRNRQKFQILGQASDPTYGHNHKLLCFFFLSCYCCFFFFCLFIWFFSLVFVGFVFVFWIGFFCLFIYYFVFC